MNPFKAGHPSVVIIFFILISRSSSSVYATEYYAFRLSGSDCTLCHADPKTGSLNQIGTSFQEEGYRYPFTWEEIFFYFLLGMTLFLIIFGFRRRYRFWHLGRSDGEYFDIARCHASPKGVAISFFIGLLRRSAPRNDKLLIAFVSVRERMDP